jgi:hypothetical protein
MSKCNVKGATRFVVVLSQPEKVLESSFSKNKICNGVGNIGGGNNHFVVSH